MRVAAIIQARMGSTRLPGKVMLPLGGEPMLKRVVERAQRIAGIDEIVVATSTLAEDAPLADYARGLGVRVHRGSALDVLARYHGAAAACGCDALVRITSDCPLLSPNRSARVVARLVAAAGAVDYASNTLVRTLPRGLDTEILTREALERAHRDAVEPQDREHVTCYVWRRPDRFRLASIEESPSHADLRWTVDTPEDCAFALRVYDELAPRTDFEYEDVLALLARKPELSAINAGVPQKVVPG